MENKSLSPKITVFHGRTAPEEGFGWLRGFNKRIRFKSPFT